MPFNVHREKTAPLDDVGYHFSARVFLESRSGSTSDKILLGWPVHVQIIMIRCNGILRCILEGYKDRVLVGFLARLGDYRRLCRRQNIPSQSFGFFTIFVGIHRAPEDAAKNLIWKLADYLLYNMMASENISADVMFVLPGDAEPHLPSVMLSTSFW